MYLKFLPKDMPRAIRIKIIKDAIKYELKTKSSKEYQWTANAETNLAD